MQHLLTSGQVGNIANNHFKTIREDVYKRWEGLGFLDGLKGHVKENIAQLYESQANALLTESTTALDSSGSFETVVFPIIRRVFSKLLANDIVSVQAMNMPIGKLFFFIPVTSDRQNNAGGHGSVYDNSTYSAHTAISNALPSCVAGDCANTTFHAKNLYDLYYNDGLFDNSKGTVTIVTTTGATPGVILSNGNFSGTSSYVAATDGSIRNVVLRVSGFTQEGKGTLVSKFSPNGNPIDTESFLASLKITSAAQIKDAYGQEIIPVGGEVPFRLVTQRYGKGIVEYSTVCDSEGALYVELDLTHPVVGSQVTADGYIGASGTTTGVTAGISFAAGSFTTSWAEYASLELETDLGEVSFNLDSVVVAAEGRKLRAAWSPELAQDVNAFHNLDAEAELTAMLSEQIAAEIDREILRDLRKGAAWQLRWDYSGWRKTATSATPYTQKDWNQTLISKINQISAQIMKTTLRGGATFIVVSSEISAIFNDLEYFHVSDASAESEQYNMGIEKVGSLEGRYQVFVDPYAPSKSIIVGHKGKSLLDTGYIYAPYQPLLLSPVMYNPFNMSPIKGITTRYAKKMVNNRYYGAITADNVPTFNMNEIR